MSKYLLFLFLIFSVFGQPLNVHVSARSAILMNGKTGAILYEKHAHIPMHPASITKIATALYVLDEKKPNLSSLVTVSADAVKMKPANSPPNTPPHWCVPEGTKMGLVKGETISIETLLHGLMKISGNDAANVIADSFSSSIPAFMQELNGYLRRLGCQNTQFLNPHGLHHEDHFTTAYDMCILTKRALQNEKFRQLVSHVPYEKPGTNKKEIKQTNALLKPGKFYYPKAIGVKTGYHSKAMHTLVAAAEDETRTLIAVLLGCEKREDRYEDAIRLFDAAFAEKKVKRVFFPSGHLFKRELKGAKRVLEASLASDLAIEYFPSEETDCRATIHWTSVILPIQKGARVGEVLIHDAKGALIEKGDLFAKDEMTRTVGAWAKDMLGL